MGRLLRLGLLLPALIACGRSGPPGDLERRLSSDAPPIDLSCSESSQCEVKDVGNCCGYYPRCVNRDFVPDLEAVRDWCKDTETVGVCGFPNITHCACVEQTCRSMQGDREV